MTGFSAELVASLNVSRETLERLKAYENILRKWMPFKNLIAPSTVDHLWTRHFADSLQLQTLAPQAKTWVDIGSGAGFPGLVIACAVAQTPGAVVHLIESDNRKCAFLREASRELGVPAHVHHGRAEHVAKTLEAEVVTARAVASLSILLDLAAPLIAAGALALFPKGRDYEIELSGVSRDHALKFEIIDSVTAKDAKILAIRRDDRFQQ